MGELYPKEVIMSVATKTASEQYFEIEGCPVKISPEGKKRLDKELEIALQQSRDNLVIPASENHLKDILKRGKERCKK